MKIAIMGAGAVGSYFGGLMAKAGLDVTLVGRGEHIRVIKEKPLMIKSYQGDFSVTVKASEDPKAVGKVDLIFFSVKSYDTEEASRSMMPMVGENTLVISIQNGIHNEEKIAKVVGEGKVLGGVSYISVRILEPGMISHEVAGKILFGELSGGMSERVERIANYFAKANLPIEPSNNIVKFMWKKLAGNAAVNSLNAVTRLPQGRFLEVPLGRQLIADMIKEVFEVGRKHGIDLDDGEINERLSIMDNYSESVSSTLQSLESGKRIESDALNGIVVKKGQEVGVSTPINKTMYAILICVGEAAMKKRR